MSILNNRYLLQEFGYSNLLAFQTLAEYNDILNNIPKNNYKEKHEEKEENVSENSYSDTYFDPETAEFIIGTNGIEVLEN